MNDKTRNKLVIYFLISIQIFIGFTAIAGGLRLVANPRGVADIPIEWLSNSPFSDYFIPGVVLLVVVGFGNLAAGAMTFFRKSHFGIIAAFLGFLLIIYMIVEVLFVGLRNFLQPLYFTLGVTVILLGINQGKTRQVYFKNSNKKFLAQS